MRVRVLAVLEMLARASLADGAYRNDAPASRALAQGAFGFQCDPCNLRCRYSVSSRR
jgi:hypothetical protein